MACHPNNSNLSLYSGTYYRSLPLNPAHAPYIAEYLEQLYQTIQYALRDYAKVLAFRLDLHLPPGIIKSEGELISRFIESFDAKVQHNRKKARQQNSSANLTKVRQVWAKENANACRSHFHLVILLNYSAFSTLGYFELGRDNLFNKLVEAWSSALQVCIEDAAGLVHIPVNPVYCLERDSPSSSAAFFTRASYLCKAETKQYGDGGHAFGCSRS